MKNSLRNIGLYMANDICENLGLEGPELPWQRKVPARLDGGSAQPSYIDAHPLLHGGFILSTFRYCNW